ncbi:MAG: protein kinase [Lachnospiraceae bacterium]|nr:protein kinase [Lachnospiraceae bacterium]
MFSPEALKKIWPEWELEGNPIGRGSYGVVYKAVRRTATFESRAAIKIISIPSNSAEIDSLHSEGFDADSTRKYLQEIVSDYVAEIELMESLKTAKNIVSIEDFQVVEREGSIGWDIYIRMELLESLGNYWRTRQLTEKDVIKLGRDICEALKICEKTGIMHRDIKPENILVNEFGDFKLGDFGIARKMDLLSHGLSKKGTPNYMAPEVATGLVYDNRADLYSLGIVLYYLLNEGRLPFLEAADQLSPAARGRAIDRRMRGEKLLPPSGASGAMADLVLRACAYDPNQRFASAEEMDAALRAVEQGTYLTFEDPDATVSLRRPDMNREEESRAATTDDTIQVKKKSSPFVIAAFVFLALLLCSPAIAAIVMHFSNEEQVDTSGYLLELMQPSRRPDSYTAKSTLKMSGENYYNGFTCLGNGGDALGTRTYFDLEGEFTTLSFTAGIAEDVGKTVTFTLYADGTRIYYFSMESGTLPTDHTVSIDNCEQLMISVYDGSQTEDASGVYVLTELIVE